MARRGLVSSLCLITVFREVTMAFRFEPIAPTQGEVWAAQEAWRRLSRVKDVAGLEVVMEVKTEVVPLPGAAVKLLVRALEAMMDGSEVAVVPTLQELSTPQAAKLMKVSRQFLAR